MSPMLLGRLLPVISLRRLLLDISMVYDTYVIHATPRSCTGHLVRHLVLEATDREPSRVDERLPELQRGPTAVAKGSASDSGRLGCKACRIVADRPPESSQEDLEAAVCVPRARLTARETQGAIFPCMCVLSNVPCAFQAL